LPTSSTICDRHADTKANSVVRVIGAKCLARGGEFSLGGALHETLRVEFLRDDVLRLALSRGGKFDEKPTHAVIADTSCSAAAFDWETGEEGATLATRGMRVTVAFSPFDITVHRTDGSVVAGGAPPDRPFYELVDGGFEINRLCHPGDAFYGLGEKTGRFNRRGRDYALWNSDVLNPNVSGGYREMPGDNPAKDPTSTAFDPYYISIPFFYHHPEGGSAMAGFFIDNGYRGEFAFGNPDNYRFCFHGGQYTEYVFAGPSMAHILDGYTWLTGLMAVPPLWALGNHQCRWHDYTQEQVGELGRRLRAEKLPCDTLWLDIDYMDGFRVFTWDKRRFPDPARLIRELEGMGFRLITIIDPGVKFDPGYAVFDDAAARGLLCQNAEGWIYVGQVWPGSTAFPDFSKEETRSWWGALNARHVRSGPAGIWNDMNEPATGDVPAEGMLFGDGTIPHDRFHNQYALLMAMGTVEGLLAAMPEWRTFVLSRAGSAGIQRYAANWLGDNVSRWEHLWMATPMALGLGVSGQPFVGADVGGFMGACNPELLVRWHQAAALTPFFRNHNAAGQPEQYAWAFGEETTRLCREAVELRYRLLPAIYSEFVRASETGLPVQRPLVMEFQDDPAVRDIDDQFLLGSHLLVAPVSEAGVDSRTVYFPRGTWYDWSTGAVIRGPQRMTVAAPLERTPLYAKGGSVIPAWPSAPRTTMGHHAEEIELHVFIPEEDGEWSSMLQEDDGLTFAFREGAVVRTEFILSRRGGRIDLRAEVSGGGYAEFSRRRFILRFHGLEDGAVWIDGRERTLEDGRIVLQNAGEPFALSVHLAAAVATI